MTPAHITEEQLSGILRAQVVAKNRRYFDELAKEHAALQSEFAAVILSAGDLAVKGITEAAEGEPDVVVAEGDSWFDYFPLGKDVLHHLGQVFKVPIAKVATKGDTLENMVYGTDIDKRSFRRKPIAWLETERLLRRHRPKVFLFSGGGNDFAGPELEILLDHANSSPRDPLRESVLEQVIDVASRKAYSDLVANVQRASRGTVTIVHGYGYAIPDGRAARIVLGLLGSGPWLRPAFARKGYEDWRRMRDVMRIIIDRFNKMLEDLSNEREHRDILKYVNLRDTIADTDWENELHLTDAGYLKVATQLFGAMQAVMTT